MLVAITVVALQGPAEPQAVEGSKAALVTELAALVPVHHELRSFDGKVTWHGHSPPPEVRYTRPDFETWAATLEETQVDPTAGRFVAIWRDSAGAIRHVLSKGDSVRLFSIDGATIEFEDPGFLTQVGVARWGWTYEEGLLRTHRTWRFSIGPVDERGLPTGPPVPDSLFAVTTYDYHRGAAVPFQSRTYWSEEDRRAGRWGQKTSYDANGRHKKTKHNKERPYPY